MVKRTALGAVIVACAVALGGGPLAAQQGSVKRTILQKTDVPD